MAARKAKRKPAKSRRPKRRRKLVRLRVCPQLTRPEVRELQARAAADMRSVGSYVAWPLIGDLRRRGPDEDGQPGASR